VILVAVSRGRIQAHTTARWSCGFCGDGITGVCGDVHGHCRRIFRGVPATAENPDGLIMCACAAAGHHKALAVLTALMF
jgi:hypothetical protein